MATPTVYVICDQNCKFESMTKEQILTAIAQAVETGEIKDVDTGFVTTIKTISGTPLRFFVGEQSEYDALTEEDKKNLFAIISNDTTKEGILAYLAELDNAIKDTNANLTAEIAAEKEARKAAVATEAQERKAADAAEKEAREAAIAAEASARKVADNNEVTERKDAISKARVKAVCNHLYQYCNDCYNSSPASLKIGAIPTGKTIDDVMAVCLYFTDGGTDYEYSMIAFKKVTAAAGKYDVCLSGNRPNAQGVHPIFAKGTLENVSGELYFKIYGILKTDVALASISSFAVTNITAYFK